MEKHITLVSVLNIGFGVLGIFAAIIVLVTLVGSGFITGDEEVIAITSIIGFSVSVFIVLISVPKIIGGIGLLKRKYWAKILVLIVAVMDRRGEIVYYQLTTLNMEKKDL